jgi:hypothetical protein
MTDEKRREVKETFARIAVRMNRIRRGDLPRVEFHRVTPTHMSGRVVWGEDRGEVGRSTSSSHGKASS